MTEPGAVSASDIQQVVVASLAIITTLVGLVVWMVKRKNGTDPQRIDTLIELHELAAEMEAEERSLAARHVLLDREQQRQRGRFDEIEAVVTDAVARLK